MAEKTEFLQAIDDAILDADSLERFINGDDTESVLTRLNAEYPTLQKTLRLMFANGGLPAVKLETLAELNASDLTEDKLAVITQDADSINGIYEKVGGQWVRSKIDSYLYNAKQDFEDIRNKFNYFGESAYVAGEYIRTTGAIATAATYGLTGYLPVVEGIKYEYMGSTTASSGGAWFDKHKQYLSGFGASMVSGVLRSDVAPEGAYYARITTDLSAPHFFRAAEYKTKHEREVLARELAVTEIDASYFTVDNAFIDKDNGSVAESALYNATDYIRVVGGERYVTNIGSYAPKEGLVWFDKNKQYISGEYISVSKPEVAVVAPTNARYLRTGHHKTNVPSPFIRGYFVHLNPDLIDDVADDVKNTAVKPLLRTKVDTSDLTVKDTYVHIGNGNEYFAVNHKSTDYIRVIAGEKYTTNMSSFAPNQGVTWFDENKVYLSGQQITGVETVTAPSNATYMRITNRTDNVADPYVYGNFGELNASLVETTKSKMFPVTEKPISFDINPTETVKTKDDLGVAYPVGRRVYVESLRNFVVADGLAWRTSDGNSIFDTKEVYVFPDWDETRQVLPSIAKSYNVVLNPADMDISKWDSEGYDKVSLSTLYGEPRIGLEVYRGTHLEWSCYKDSPITGGVKKWFIFDYYANIDLLKLFHFGLFNANGEAIFWKEIKNSANGIGNKAQTGESRVQVEITLDEMQPLSDTASFDDVAYIGFKIDGINDSFRHTVHVSKVENVDFKPKLTLRFDDHENSIYDNAYRIMKPYGFKGIIAVITGAPDLDNDPRYNQGVPRITKQQLFELRDEGWDLVSHGHVHQRAVNTDSETLRDDYRKSRDYLRDELQVGMINSSTIISAHTYTDARVLPLMREFFDCVHTTVSRTTDGWNHINSQMMRQPSGNRLQGRHWSNFMAFGGDNSESIDRLVEYCEAVIALQGWGQILIHRVSDDFDTYNVKPAIYAEFMQWLDDNKHRIDVVTPSQVVKTIRPE